MSKLPLERFVSRDRARPVISRPSSCDPSHRGSLPARPGTTITLTQPDDEGRQRPVAYESRKLTAAERNQPALVIELLAVVHALRV